MQLPLSYIHLELNLLWGKCDRGLLPLKNAKIVKQLVYITCSFNSRLYFNLTQTRPIPQSQWNSQWGQKPQAPASKRLWNPNTPPLTVLFSGWCPTQRKMIQLQNNVSLLTGARMTRKGWGNEDSTIWLIPDLNTKSRKNHKFHHSGGPLEKYHNGVQSKWYCPEIWGTIYVLKLHCIHLNHQ